MNQKELEKYIATRPSAKESNGAWKRFVESEKLAEKETPKDTWDRLDKNEKTRQQKYIEKLEKFGIENSQQKAPVINYIEKKREYYNDPILEDRGKQTVAINHTANKYLNNQVNKGNIKKEDLMLTPDKNGLLTNKSKTIAMRDSFMAKQFNNALGVKDMPTEATPEQFGKLAERLEKDRQMRGAPTNVQQFKKNFNNINSKKPTYPGMKTWEKKKVSKPVEPVKIDITPTYFPPIIERDPQMEIAQRKFDRLSKEIKEEKFRNAHSGIAGIVGGDPKFYDK